MSSKVTLSYLDESGMPDNEICRGITALFGDSVKIDIAPPSSNPEACIHFGLLKLITDFQLHHYFDDPESEYQRQISKKRKDLLKLVEDILDTIIIDNESKWEE